MGAYYNEFDPYAAEWLRNLIAAGVIAPGDVDERSIAEVQASDLRGYTQCHFFAGVGGWSYALRLAGWGDDRPIWTGSCPCQPFSVAGKGLGESDPRHLWPEFRRLIAECRPAVTAGEQVASADGRGWLAGVRADLEALGYRVGAADLCAAGVGAPHIQQRLYWVGERLADTDCDDGRRAKSQVPETGDGGWQEVWSSVAGGVQTDGLGHATSGGCGVRIAQDGASVPTAQRTGGGVDGGLGDACGAGLARREGLGGDDAGQLAPAQRAGDATGWIPHTEHDGRGPDQPGRGPDRGAAAGGSGADGGGVPDAERGPRGPEHECASGRRETVGAEHGAMPGEGGSGPWGSTWLPCLDGRWRRVEPQSSPLAHGVPRSVADLRARLGLVGCDPSTPNDALREARRYRKGVLRGMGNAIVPQVAAEFIGAYMDITDGTGGR